MCKTGKVDVTQYNLNEKQLKYTQQFEHINGGYSRHTEVIYAYNGRYTNAMPQNGQKFKEELKYRSVYDSIINNCEPDKIVIGKVQLEMRQDTMYSYRGVSLDPELKEIILQC